MKYVDRNEGMVNVNKAKLESYFVFVKSSMEGCGDEQCNTQDS
jgi:hypothetical protein